MALIKQEFYAFLVHNDSNLTTFSNTVKLFAGMVFTMGFLLFQNKSFGNEINKEIVVVLNQEDYKTIEKELDVNQVNELRSRPYPILQLFRAKQKKNKKITAAVLAFPFPFGIVGLHRIYLGTAPHVPVVYIGTLGGVLGILPFIDFCVLVLDKNIDRFIDNPKVLMWVDENKNVGK
ncbi:MAG: NINE protein [Bacteroidia bacterium]